MSDEFTFNSNLQIENKFPIPIIIIIIVVIVIILLIIIFKPKNGKNIFKNFIKNNIKNNLCRKCIDSDRNNHWCVIKNNNGYCTNKYGFNNLSKECSGIKTRNCNVEIKKGSTVKNNCELCLSDRDTFENEWCLGNAGKPGYCVNFFGKDGHPTECSGTKVSDCSRENRRNMFN